MCHDATGRTENCRSLVVSLVYWLDGSNERFAGGRSGALKADLDLALSQAADLQPCTTHHEKVSFMAGPKFISVVSDVFTFFSSIRTKASMDPVSIAASLVTLVGATKGVVNLIRQYSASVKGAKRDVIQLTDEINRLRSCLEFLAQSLKIQDHSISTVTSDLKAIKELCDPESGDIAKELRYINEKLRLPSDANHQSARGIGLLRSLTWPLKEKETKKLLETVERLKSSLELALNINQT